MGQQIITSAAQLQLLVHDLYEGNAFSCFVFSLLIFNQYESHPACLMETSGDTFVITFGMLLAPWAARFISKPARRQVTGISRL